MFFHDEQENPKYVLPGHRYSMADFDNPSLDEYNPLYIKTAICR
jgi:hypothetical protein